MYRKYLLVILLFTNSIVFADIETNGKELLEVYIRSNDFELKSNAINTTGHWDTLVDTYLTLSRNNPELEVTVTSLNGASIPAKKVADRLTWLGGKNIKITKAKSMPQEDAHEKLALLEQQKRLEIEAKIATEREHAKMKELERVQLEKRQKHLMELEEESFNSEIPEFSESCQEWTKVNSYEFNFNGHEIFMPKNLELVFNGNQTFKSEKITNWLSPYNSIYLATTNDKIIIQIIDGDCEDSYDRKLLIINDVGEVLAKEDIWTEHWDDAFFFRNNNITYWSEWFCHKNNKEASINNSYVYTWPGYGEFKKEAVSREEMCSENAISTINQIKLKFELHAPIEQ